VYAASEGLRTLIVEACSIGGQAGTSSMIRNYLGFPRGVSGEDLTFRAYEQALMFGTKFVFMRRATALETRGDQHIITLSDGSTVTTRAVIIATGVEYRRLDIPALVRLIGAGVFYGAAGVEAPSMAGESVYVIGGANSAGQAALHLAKFAARVSLLVRGPSLDSMSEYLITELHSTPNIEIRLNTRVVDGQGEYRLEGLVLENTKHGEREAVPAAAVFVLIGAETRTEWLGDQLQRDPRGFILTGRDTTSEYATQSRQPRPFETTIPGVFAVGDVRHGSVKRVAGAVGDGSVAVSTVHQYLAETASSSGSAPSAAVDSSSLRLLPL
jgi:thioredoxin reductase (NADPH)